MALAKIKLNELTPKADPILADSIVISDSENSGKGALVEITDLQTLIGGGGGGGGAVDSVAGKTGVVTLDASDIAETAALKIMTADERTKLTGIAENANNYTHPASHPQSMIEGLEAAIAACRPKHQYIYISTSSTAIAAERGKTYGLNANGCTLTLPAANTADADGDEICVVLGVSAARELAIVSPSIIMRGTGQQPANTPFNISGFGTLISFTKYANAWMMGYPEYELSLKAPLASPALTGNPTAPTAAVGTNTTQLATTAFVQAATASAIYDLPVTRSGTVSPGTDVVLLETGVLDPAWYDETHVLNVSFFARNETGVNESRTFKLQLYDEGTSTSHTITSITGFTQDYRLLQASIYRTSSSSLNCNIQYGYLTGFGSVSLAVGSYKLRAVFTSTLSTVFGAAQVRFTK